MSEQKAEYLGETPEEVKHEIRDEAPHDFFTMIPHIVEALDLTPYAFRLYAHLKRVTGENKTGKCWKSTSTLAKACRMSAGSISNAKKELENTYPPLIRITSKMKDNAIYHEITIIDVWQMNSDLGNGIPVHLVKTPIQRSCGERPRSCGETKKSTVKKNPLSNDSLKNSITSTGGLDWQVLGGVPSEDIESLNKTFALRKEKTDAFEREMVYNPLDWGDKKLAPLEKFLEDKSFEDIHRFAEWSKREFSSLSPTKARQYPHLVIDLWLQACPPIIKPEPPKWKEPEVYADLTKLKIFKDLEVE